MSCASVGHRSSLIRVHTKEVAHGCSASVLSTEHKEDCPLRRSVRGGHRRLAVLAPCQEACEKPAKDFLFNWSTSSAVSELKKLKIELRMQADWDADLPNCQNLLCSLVTINSHVSLCLICCQLFGHSACLPWGRVESGEEDDDPTNLKELVPWCFTIVHLTLCLATTLPNLTKSFV